MAVLFEAFLAGKARPFFSGAHFAEPADRLAAVSRTGRLRADVGAVLAAQQELLPASAARSANLAALIGGAAAVVTGQQAGLFGGPLFTFYKAATAVVAARSLSRECGRPVVPIFWLQSEDHDLAEIAQISYPRTQPGPLALRVTAAADQRVSVAHCLLPDDVDAALGELGAELHALPEGEAHLTHLRRHYRPGVGWVAAFAGLLADFFPELIFVEPRDPAFAALAAPIHERALREAPALARLLGERCDTLGAAGYDTTVHVRADSPLSFFHPQGAEGPRYRLDADGREIGGDGVHDVRHTLSILRDDPRRLSSSALLRPIIQDALLPTVAYIGGPGEVAYFAQLEPLYRAFGVNMPLVVPRARFRLIDDRLRRLLERLGLSAADAARPEAELLKRDVPAGVQQPEAVLLDPFEATLEALTPSLVAAGCERAVEKTRATVRMAVGKLGEKYREALARQDAERVEAIRRLRGLLFPDGVPQERVYGVAYYMGRYGEAAFRQAIVDHLEPFSGAIAEVSLGGGAS